VRGGGEAVARKFILQVKYGRKVGRRKTEFQFAFSCEQFLYYAVKENFLSN
jgi:hypothetical protein